MVLKFPFTSAASTKGLQRYRGFCPAGDAGGMGGGSPGLSKVAEVGVVGERRGLRGWRPIERPMELKNDIWRLRQAYCLEEGDDVV